MVPSNPYGSKCGSRPTPLPWVWNYFPPPAVWHVQQILLKPRGVLNPKAKPQILAPPAVLPVQQTLLKPREGGSNLTPTVSVFVFQKTSSSWKRFGSVFCLETCAIFKLLFFGKHSTLPHFGKYLKLPYFVKCNQLFHFFEIATTCRHFWLFHKCNFHKVSYSNGWKEVSSLMSKPFANDICKLLSH